MVILPALIEPEVETPLTLEFPVMVILPALIEPEVETPLTLEFPVMFRLPATSDPAFETPLTLEFPITFKTLIFSVLEVTPILRIVCLPLRNCAIFGGIS